MAERERHQSRNSLISMLSLGHAKPGVASQALRPSSQEHCEALLETYFSHVDPLIRVTHKPTLRRKFSSYIRDGHVLAYAVFYSAINALPPSDVEEGYGEKKMDLLERYEQGVELSLANANFLTTSSLEILQGFVIWLVGPTCLCARLLLIAIRHALRKRTTWGNPMLC
jgi:hypothetical protein